MEYSQACVALTVTSVPDMWMGAHFWKKCKKKLCA